MNILLWLSTFILQLHFMSGVPMRQGIIGGRDSAPHSRPYMVLIVNLFTSENCDGILVSKDFVLTAAHCNGKILVFLGVHNVEELKINNSIFVKTIPHPLYNNKTYENDIMLLKLEKPAEFSEKVMPIALASSRYKNFTHNCLVIGWGCQTFSNEFPSKVLKEVNVTITENDAPECASSDMLCSEGFTGPGKGDSGGPLVCGDVAHGIVSINFKNQNDFVSRYIRISYHLKWIKSVINRTNE